jgi:ABC-2 type transport system ATP-binding protein
LRRGSRPSLSPCQGRRTLNTPLLSAKGVSRRYGRVVALAPTSLEVHPGDALALIGPNGAGKSTLLSILAGGLDPTEGSIVSSSANVGWVPQRPAHYQRLSPRENLELFARLEGVPHAKAVAGRYLGLLDLPDDGRLTAQLSAGNQQRLNVAVALLARPDVLLLDEPTASLDPRQRRLLWEVAAQVRERDGAVVFATQNLEELERFATRVAVLVGGELVFDGSLEQFKAAPEADVFA